MERNTTIGTYLSVAAVVLSICARASALISDIGFAFATWLVLAVAITWFMSVVLCGHALFVGRIRLTIVPLTVDALLVAWWCSGLFWSAE